VLATADLGPDPLARIAALRALPDAPELVLLDRDGGAEGRAAAVAAGCLAVLDAGLSSRRLAAALTGVCERLRAALATSLPVRGERVDHRLEALGSRSDAIRRLHAEARAAAASDAPILLQGEPGVGKTWLGPALHLESARRTGPFRRLRCSGLGREELCGALFGHEAEAVAGSARARRGLCEEAHGGTLFLEHLDEAGPSGQREILRFLDDRTVRPLGGDKEIEVEVRVVASIQERTRSELVPELRARVGLSSLVIPPLRERRDDVPELALAALGRLRARYGLELDGFDEDALEALVRHSWPGNLSELWSVVERAALVARGGRIAFDDLPRDFEPGVAGGPGQAASLRLEADWLLDPARLPTLREWRQRCLEVVERAYLAEVLRASGGRVGEAARRADVDPRSLHARMRRLGLRKEDFKYRRPRRRASSRAEPSRPEAGGSPSAGARS